MSSTQAQRNSPLPAVFAIEAICSATAHLVGVSIFFFMQHRFGWGALENLTFASTRGVVFIAGALLAHALSGRFGRRKLLVGIQAMLCAVMLLSIGATSLGPLPVAVLGCLYAMVGGVLWPTLESLVSGGADATTIGRRLGIYNMIWPATGALAVAVSGAIIEHWALGLFILSAIGHAVSMVIAWRMYRDVRRSASLEAPAAPGHLEAEPALLRMRVVALWLSRVALPATYIVTYALASMLPSLPILRGLDPTQQTLLGSVWLVGRFCAFAVLGLTVFWHTRPRLLLGATVLMLVSFLGITIRPSEIGFGTDWTGDASVMIVAQLAIGFAIGLIYSASLYFGMVLSQGSTKHGGYHEALIGLGSTIGPLAGAVVQWIRPGDVRASALAVGGVLAVTVVCAVAVAGVARRRRV